MKKTDHIGLKQNWDTKKRNPYLSMHGNFNIICKGISKNEHTHTSVCHLKVRCVEIRLWFLKYLNEATKIFLFSLKRTPIMPTQVNGFRPEADL